MEKYSPFSPQYIPIELVQSESFELSITFSDEETGDPINLTGYIGRMQIRQTLTADNPPVLDLTTENGSISIDGYNGGVEIFVPDNVTKLLPPEFEGVWDLFLYGSNGIATQLLKGTVKISRSVTHE